MHAAKFSIVASSASSSLASTTPRFTTGGSRRRLSADLSAALSGTLRKAGFTPSAWPTSSRNAGRLHSGTVAGFKSESMADFRRNHHAGLRIALQVLVDCARGELYELSRRLAVSQLQAFDERFNFEKVIRIFLTSYFECSQISRGLADGHPGH